MRKIIFSSVALLIAVTFIPTTIYAQQNGSGDQAGSSQTEEEKETARQARLDEAKQKIADKLSNTEERRIAGLCKASQVIITRLHTRVETTTQSRKSRYDTVSEKLATLVEKLTLASIDTTNLEATIAVMGEKVTAHIASMQAYQTSLGDLAEMDCATDPSGFKAVLLSLREQRATLLEQAKELKNYITVEIKASLAEIRTQLEASSPEEEA